MKSLLPFLCLSLVILILNPSPCQGNSVPWWKRPIKRQAPSFRRPTPQRRQSGGGAVIFGDAHLTQQQDEQERLGRKIRPGNNRDTVVINPPKGEDDKEKKNDEGDVKPLDYLFQFGYLPKTSSRSPFVGTKAATVSQASAEFRNAVVSFQEFAGLAQTGELDKETKELMTSPRCGVADKRRSSPRFKRYIAHTSKWATKHLKYHISSYPSDSLMSKFDVENEIEKAFRIWERKTVLSFSRTHNSGEADMALDFFSGSHGADEPFDGRGGVLAHAFFPRWGGDVHFDSAENWVNDALRFRVKNGQAKQLLQTAVHEIGHSLGLEHSKNRDAIMAPFYHGWLDNLDLKEDDVMGIESIYGRGSTSSGTTKRPSVVIRPSRRPKGPTTTTRRPTRRPTTTRRTTTKRPSTIFNNNNKPVFTNKKKTNLCMDPVFEAVTRTQDGSFYAFKGDQYWKLLGSSAGVADGYPKPNTDWGNLPGEVNAAFYNPRDGMTYLFQDGMVGKYRNLRLQSGYPKRINDEFLGAPTGKLDAALYWGHNRQLYFFKGSQYWKYNFGQKKVETSYPKRISSNWVGVPSHLSAAVRWKNGKSYFFDKSGQYYRFNDKTFSVTNSAKISYPRRVSKWWLGCDTRRQTVSGSEEASVESSEVEIFSDKDYVYEYDDREGDEPRAPRKSWVWSD